jgi:hypothetical protein
MTGKRLWALGVALAVTLAGSGCAKTPPPVTEVSGVVLLNGKPLPHAKVEFVPELSDFGAEMNSTAITDEQGRFTLTCAHESQPGAVVGKHHVLVSEAPTPAQFRRQDAKTMAEYQKYKARLKNRPIPPAYGDLGKKRIVIEVTTDQKTYEIKLKR